MIQMPRRSVTRFFIPLIDVLILLFCIFLLMPLFKAQAEPGAEPPPDGDHAGQGPQESRDTIEKLRAEVERLRKEKGQPLQERLAVRVLEIDPATGVLFYYGPQRVELRTEADARDLMVRDRQEVGAGRELYYEILYPRDPASPFPLAKQRTLYDDWLKDVPHGWDVPGEPLKGGKR
jgi:hypothetical protein